MARWRIEVVALVIACAMCAVLGVVLSIFSWFVLNQVMEWGLITESALTKTMVSNDAVYTGSLTFAGLVLFSSIMISRIDTIANNISTGRRLLAMIVIGGAYVLAVFHVGFAFMYGYVVVVVGQLLALVFMAMFSVVLIVTIVSAFVLFIRTSKDSGVTG